MWFKKSPQSILGYKVVMVITGGDTIQGLFENWSFRKPKIWFNLGQVEKSGYQKLKFAVLLLSDRAVQVIRPTWSNPKSRLTVESTSVTFERSESKLIVTFLFDNLSRRTGFYCLK